MSTDTPHLSIADYSMGRLLKGWVGVTRSYRKWAEDQRERIVPLVGK